MSEVLHKLVQSLPVGEVACGTDELQSLPVGEVACGADELQSLQEGKDACGPIRAWLSISIEAVSRSWFSY